MGEGCQRDVFVDEATLLLPVSSYTLRHPSIMNVLRYVPELGTVCTSLDEVRSRARQLLLIEECFAPGTT